MLKQNKWKILITTLVILIPMLIGCLLWKQLPSAVITHWGANNEADGFSSKAFAVFGMPAILAALHLLCIVMTAADPKQKNIGTKPLGLVFWIIPSITLLIFSIIYAGAMGVQVNVGFFVILLIGVFFILLGNLLPKTKQNYTFGLKLPWTLNDPENWNRTHRFAGWCMVLAGVIILLTAYWQNLWIFLGVLLLAVFAPVAYSFIYYKRHPSQK
ncbi:MAG: DUF1648 domain-containing protein [Oscillospiraceae bacterium]|nr:DUF1648 domain-containing protein [Oscillospiraceae bacterium]